MELTTLLALTALPFATAETVLGLYIFHRHGDRTTKSWPPTSLTPLGADQVLSSGTYYRNRYVASDASTPIKDLSSNLAVLSQMTVTAPLDTVLQNSAQVFLQGLYPPAGTAAQDTLANGTVTEAPFGGYQYIPVNGVATAATGSGGEDSAWLQGTSGCGNAVVSSNNYFSSQEYLQTLARTAGFYKSLLPVINGTFSESQATFKNGYAIADLIAVSQIHNKTIPSSALLTPEALHQIETLADEHEWNLAYNASDPIRAIAGATLSAQILQSLNTTLHAPKSSSLKMGIQFGAYGTFMSLFGLAALPAASPAFYGIVDYASSIVFELVTNSTATPPSPADVGVRFLFSNGTADLRPFPLFGQQQTVLPWSVFSAEMGKIATGHTADWCRACGNSTGVCAEFVGEGGVGAAGAGGGGGSGGGISTTVAGVIGALVTLVVILGVEGLVMAVAGLRVVKKGVAARGKAAEGGNGGL